MFNYNDIELILDRDSEIIGNKNDIQFDSCLPIDEAKASSIVWLSPENKNKISSIDGTAASNIIIQKNEFIPFQKYKDKIFILVDNPKLIYQRIVQNLFFKRNLNGVHHTAIINNNAKLGQNVNIGPFAYIGDAEIGDNVYIYGNVYIHDKVKIGNNVIIQSGSVIGSDGFGLTRNENYEFENFPHIGGVIIEDNVEIGANTTIDRGTLGNTLLKEGCKIDNLVHIAHNVEIGKHTAIVANVMIAGSTKIGDFCWIAPSSSIRDRVNIPSNTTIGLGAIVVKSVNKSGIYTGNPAKELTEVIKIQNYLNKIL